MDRARETAIDECLTRSLESAQKAWGAEFADTYPAAQPWLFSSQEGAAIVIPSVDKVGRTFPLYAAIGSEVVLQFLYDAVVDAIGQGDSADALIETFQRAPARQKGPSDEPEGRWFCIDPVAPSLPRCWDEYRMTPGESSS